MNPVGVYDKWKKVPLIYSQAIIDQACNVQANEVRLKEYIETGKLRASSRPTPDVLPKYQDWESTYLEIGLNVLGSYIQQKEELACFAGGKSLSSNAMGNSFMYFYYSQLIIQHIYALQKILMILTLTVCGVGIRKGVNIHS